MLGTFLLFEAFRHALTQNWRKIWILQIPESLKVPEFEA